MTGILNKFYVERGVHGAKIIARSNQLTADCVAEGDIEASVQLLKADLDACAREMKRRVALEQRGSLFEGWATVDSDVLVTSEPG